MEGSLCARKSANHRWIFSMASSPLCSSKQIMQISPALEILLSFCLHPFRAGDRIAQFCPNGTRPALLQDSFVPCVVISISVKVNNELGNKACGRAKLQLGSACVK